MVSAAVETLMAGTISRRAEESGRGEERRRGELTEESRRKESGRRVEEKGDYRDVMAVY